MKTESEAKAGSVNADLAEYLCQHKESILSDWRERVRGDTEITPGKSLDSAALTNRLPFIFDDLNATLRCYGSSKIAEKNESDAQEHGSMRWRQGYELSEVMREFKHFRSLLIYHLRIFEDLHPDNGMAAMLFVSTILHRFLDEMVLEATEEFLASQLTTQRTKVH